MFTSSEATDYDEQIAYNTIRGEAYKKEAHTCHEMCLHSFRTIIKNMGNEFLT